MPDSKSRFTLRTELADKVENEVGARKEHLERDMKLSRRSVFNGKFSGSDRCTPISSISTPRRVASQRLTRCFLNAMSIGE